MNLKIIFISLITLIALPISAKAAISDLKSYPVWIAAGICHNATGRCATKFEVKAGHSNHVTGSCHYVDKAVDVYGSNACLNAFALCIAAQVVNPVLYCYKNWGIGGMINWVNSGSCTPANHQTHLHLQPLFGCRSRSNNR